ncbi:MAG TPA: LLM class F420-dependent oxidoreductase [Acidimicrobiales bacterium]|jgi:probable F420-dependent oxidoreductase|nr:LLM class F420-dependent oxidoreductase [Acidimicrobiales bacterium]
MKVGAFVPIGTLNANPDFVRHVGPALEERGFESLWVAEHVVLFDDYASQYPYSDTGRFPGGGDSGLLEPLTALAYVAATTTTLRLGTGICLVGQRNPVYTAKQVADVDVLSGGRVDFGIGIGWLREEFDAVAMPFDHRGARSDEHLEVMKRLWVDDPSSYDGRYYQLPECRMYPKPVQQPHPPIHVGGESDGALRRAARFGQGWFGFNRQPEQVPEALERLDRALGDEGRSRAEVEISVSPYFTGTDSDGMKRYADLGVDRVILVVFGFDLDGLRKAADDAAELVDAAER